MRLVIEPTVVNTVSKRIVSVENSSLAEVLVVTSKSVLQDCMTVIIANKNRNILVFFMGYEVNEILYIRIIYLTPITC